MRLRDRIAEARIQILDIPGGIDVLTRLDALERLREQIERAHCTGTHEASCGYEPGRYECDCGAEGVLETLAARRRELDEHVRPSPWEGP